MKIAQHSPVPEKKCTRKQDFRVMGWPIFKVPTVLQSIRQVRVCNYLLYDRTFFTSHYFDALIGRDYLYIGFCNCKRIFYWVGGRQKGTFKNALTTAKD